MLNTQDVLIKVFMCLCYFKFIWEIKCLWAYVIMDSLGSYVDILEIYVLMDLLESYVPTIESYVLVDSLEGYKNCGII